MPAARSATAQLTLDGADRLHALLGERRAPIAVGEAAGCLFALRSAPAALTRQLVDEVVQGRRPLRVAFRRRAGPGRVGGGRLAARRAARAGRLRGLRPGDDRHQPRSARASSRSGRCGLGGLDAGGTVPAPGRPGLPVPRRSPRITGITPPTCAGGRDRPLPGRVPALLAPARCWSRTTPASTSASWTPSWAGGAAAGWRHRSSTRSRWPAACWPDRLPRMDLATLAERFDTAVRPCHRALPDAEATAEVLVQAAGHGPGARRAPRSAR